VQPSVGAFLVHNSTCDVANLASHFGLNYRKNGYSCGYHLGREFRIDSGAPPGPRRKRICRKAGILPEFRERLIQRSLERQHGSKYHMVRPKYLQFRHNSGTYVIPGKFAGRIRNPEFRTEFRRNSLPRWILMPMTVRTVVPMLDNLPNHGKLS
jgi:hypothetical protein